MILKVIVGLGNPGPAYYSSRHNTGFRVVDLVGTANGAQFSHKRSLFADTAKITVSGSEVLLVKPTTYMNDSGRAVVAVLRWYKTSLCDLLVVHDDVSLPLGKLRLQAGGGAGGQHGIESVIQCLGGKNAFARLKVGVGPDPGGDRRADYVLAGVPLADSALWQKCLETSASAALCWVLLGAKETMNQFNGLNLDESA